MVSRKERGMGSRTFQRLGKTGRAPAAASHAQEPGGPAGKREHVLGGLLHLRPPAVVGVADEQQDLTPEEHQCRVRGDHGAHPRVQALQAVEAAVRTVRQEPRGSCSDPPECPWKPRTERITGTRLRCSSQPNTSQSCEAFTPEGYTQGSFLHSHVQGTWHSGNSSLTTRFLNQAAMEAGAPPSPPPHRDQTLQGL